MHRDILCRWRKTKCSLLSCLYAFACMMVDSSNNPVHKSFGGILLVDKLVAWSRDTLSTGARSN